MESSSFSLPIHLLRQWCFCPRIIYYQELLQIKPEKPLWVEQGEKFHIRIEELEKRRNLSRYGLASIVKSGKVHYRVNLQSQKLKLHGIADCILEGSNEVFISEYKVNPQPHKLAHKLQITAYAMVAEEVFEKKCNQGFLVGIKKQTFPIEIDDNLKEKVIEKTKDIEEMFIAATKPSSSATIAQCGQCEYLNYCNDRL